MKNFKIIYILIVALSCIGCNNTIKKELPGVQKDHMLPNVDSNKPVSRQTIIYSDPALYGGGCGIFRYFLALLRTMKFEEAISITAKSSIEKYGRERILTFYKNINTDYSPVLLSVAKNGNITTLRYRVNRYATKKLITLNTINENDSVRILLPDRLEMFLK